MRQTIAPIEIRDEILQDVNLDYKFMNTWLGKAFLLTKNGYPGKRTIIMLAGRYYTIRFNDRPLLVNQDFIQPLHNRSLMLFSMGYSRQGFTKGSLIYSFGRTEDIPTGRMLQLIGGYEYGEFENRPYAGVSLSNGFFLKENGSYLYNRVSVGSYFDNKRTEQGTIDISSRFFTRLYGSARYKFRYFFNVNYTYGLNRFRDEYLSIENREGISGLESDLLKGTQKLTLNVEAVSFSPFTSMVSGLLFLVSPTWE
ncbi:MAG: hypothetical protein HC906_12540 [Bacteroidales bacterium]|nr:hypothetical protein [Bacteroidales bacterium]